MFQPTGKCPESPWGRRKPPNPAVRRGASGVFSDRMDFYILHGIDDSVPESLVVAFVVKVLAELSEGSTQ